MLAWFLRFSFYAEQAAKPGIPILQYFGTRYDKVIESKLGLCRASLRIYL